MLGWKEDAFLPLFFLFFAFFWVDNWLSGRDRSSERGKVAICLGGLRIPGDTKKTRERRISIRDRQHPFGCNEWLANGMMTPPHPTPTFFFLFLVKK